MTNPTLAVYIGAPQSKLTAAEFWADPSSWTDVTSSLSEVTWKRGRQGLLDSMGGGTGRLVFNNNQREWEPTNPDGLNWPLSERQVKIEATLGGFPATAVLDDFNRANTGPPPSASWTTWLSDGLKVVSNQCAPNDSGDNNAYWNTAMTHADVEAYVTIATPPATGGVTHVFVRLDTATVSSYSVACGVNAGNDDIQLFRWDGGVATSIAGPYSVAFANGDKIGIRCHSSQIEAWVSLGGIWQKLGAVTDTTYSGASPNNKIALHNVGNGTTAARYDDFGGGVPTYPLFRGWTQEWEVTWDPAWESGTIAAGKGGKSEVDVELVDAIGILSNWEVAGWGTVTEPGTVTMGTALMRELDTVGFQWGMRDIDSSSATQVVRVPDRGAAWTNVQDYVQSDLLLRQAWVDGRGYFTFGIGSSSGVTFGDAAGELPYGKTQNKLGLDLVFTDVAVTAAQPGAVEQRTGPTRSGNPTPFLHGSRSKTLQTRNQSDADALTLSQAIWDRHWQPRARPGPVTVRPGGGSDALWAALLNMELQDTFLFRRRPPGSGTWEQTLQVMGLAHSVRLTTADWTTTFDVAGEFVLFPAALVVDDANRADSGPPPAGWTVWIDSGIKIVSNQFAPNDTGDNGAYWTTSMTGPDVDAYVTIATIPALGGLTQVGARVDPAGGGGLFGDGYAIRHTVGSPDTVKLYRYDNSVETVLDTAILELGNGDGIGIRCRGSSIEGWVRLTGVWQPLLAATDTTYAGTGSNVKVGLFNSGNGTSAARYDDFGAGSIPRAN